MSSWRKRRRGREGSLLIEALAAVTVLAVGVVTVMGAFALQRQGVSRHQAVTRGLFAVEDEMAARWAGLSRRYLKGVSVSYPPAPEIGTGLRAVKLAAVDPSAASAEVVIYERSDRVRRR